MLNFAIGAARKAGILISDNAGREFQIAHKGRIDLLTNVDKGAQAILSNAIDSLVNALAATGFPNSLDRDRGTINRFQRVLYVAQRVRLLGSAALNLSYVACGRFNAFWEEGLKAWGIAADIVILQDADGRDSSFEGSGMKLSQGEILASNIHIHNELIGLI